MRLLSRELDLLSVALSLSRSSFCRRSYHPRRDQAAAAQQRIIITSHKKIVAALLEFRRCSNKKASPLLSGRTTRVSLLNGIVDM